MFRKQFLGELLFFDANFKSQTKFRKNNIASLQVSSKLPFFHSKCSFTLLDTSFKEKLLLPKNIRDYFDIVPTMRVGAMPKCMLF